MQHLFRFGLNVHGQVIFEVQTNEDLRKPLGGARFLGFDGDIGSISTQFLKRQRAILMSHQPNLMHVMVRRPLQYFAARVIVSAPICGAVNLDQ